MKKFEELSGYGLKVRVDGKDILAGNTKLMDLEKIAIENEERIRNSSLCGNELENMQILWLLMK